MNETCISSGVWHPNYADPHIHFLLYKYENNENE